VTAGGACPVLFRAGSGDGEHPAGVPLAGLGWNLVWVTLGNGVSGAEIGGIGHRALLRTPPRPSRQRSWQPRIGMNLIEISTDAWGSRRV
jgi:hypothetical protein